MNTKLAFSLLAAALIAAGCSKETPKPAAEQSKGAASSGAASSGDSVEIKIGHVAPLTGGNAHLGKDNENGVRLAVDEANAKGKVTSLPKRSDADEPSDLMAALEASVSARS